MRNISGSQNVIYRVSEKKTYILCYNKTIENMSEYKVIFSNAYTMIVKHFYCQIEMQMLS